MSNFRTIVENILAEHDYDDWDSNDHTGDHMIDWTIDLPMNDDLRNIIIGQNIVGEEDLKDDLGNWLNDFETDVVIDYEVIGYPDDEEISINKVYLPDYDAEIKNKKFDELIAGTDITPFISEDFLGKIAKQLEQSGKVELHSYDYEKQVRDDYYDSVL